MQSAAESKQATAGARHLHETVTIHPQAAVIPATKPLAGGHGRCQAPLRERDDSSPAGSAYGAEIRIVAPGRSQRRVRRRSGRGSETQPFVAWPVASCRKIAEPWPGTAGPRL
jgi:hypothetical protein